MTWHRRLAARVVAVFRGRVLDDQLDEELRLHVDMLTADHIASGLAPDEARRRALVSLGGLEGTRAAYRDARSFASLATLSQDIRFAVRSLLRQPVFTAVVIAALALAIGASTAVFSLLNAVLLEPLPYPDPQQIVAVATRFTNIGATDNRNFISPPEFRQLAAQSRAFSSLAAYATDSFNLVDDGNPERFLGARTTPEYFAVLGVQPRAGRTFSAEDGLAGRDDIAVVSYGLWQSRLGGDLGAVGRRIDVNGRPTTIIGVMPAAFEDPAGAAIWTPLVFTDEQLSESWRGNHYLRVLARLGADTTPAQAAEDMDRVSTAIINAAPGYDYAEANFAVLLFPLLDETVGEVRPALWLMMGAVTLVLLIACANVANLMILRAAARTREMGVRTALGATRGRLGRQLLTESLVLALAGGAAGVALAWLAVRVAATWAGQTFPRVTDASVDMTTLVFTTLVAMATGVIFGMLPAMQVSQLRTSRALSDDGDRGHSASEGRQMLRRTLVMAEVAMALALVSGAGLLVKSFARLQDVDPGFHSADVLTMRTSLPAERYDGEAAVAAFYRQWLDQIRILPGVVDAGAINALPLSGRGGSGTVTMDTTAVPTEASAVEAERRFVTPGYLEAMRVRVIDGRLFTDRDDAQGPPVAIVDESLATTYWPGESAVGKRLHFGGLQSTQPWRTVVGVVQHTRFHSLERPSRVEVYLPHAQSPLAGMTLAIRTDAPVETIVPAVRRSLFELDPTQPIYEIQPMDDVVGASVARRQIVMVLLAAFAAAAFVLAALGIYGLLSYWVTQRSREIAVRLALGATRSHAVGLVLRQGLVVVAVGMIAGLGLAVLLTRLVENMLFDIDPFDPGTFALTSAVLVIVSLVATFVPAFRASRMDPMETLRQG